MSKELQEREEKFYQYTAIDEYTRIRYMSLTEDQKSMTENLKRQWKAKKRQMSL